MSDISLSFIIVGSCLAVFLIVIFALSIHKKRRGKYDIDYDSSYSSSHSDLDDDRIEKRVIDDEVHFTTEDEEEILASGVDALKGEIRGPWKSVIASIISANRGVSREHLGYAPVSQVLNEVAPANKNVSLNLDKNQLNDFLGYVKLLESSLEKQPSAKKGVTPQEKYRMLQRAFEDKRDLDTTKEARAHSREIIRQEKIKNHKFVSEEQLAKVDAEIGARVEALVDDNPENELTINEFKGDLKGNGLVKRKKLGRKEK